MRKETLSFTIGPSIASRLEIKPAPALNLYLVKSPSLVLTFSTEDILPPNWAGMLPLYKVNSSTTSGLKFENKPNAWDELKIWPLSIITRFWSMLPPRTLNPPLPSPTVDTPGRSKRLLTTSTSPISAGNRFNSLILNWNLPGDISLTFSSGLLALTIISSKTLGFSFMKIFSTPVA